MRVLIACEISGRVRDAFIKKGHDAVSCDLLPTDSPGPHIIGDAIEVAHSEHWDLMVAHPPCTYLASSGIHWNKKVPGRSVKTDDAVVFVTSLMAAPIEKIAIENPIGVLSTRIRKPEQIIQPYQFGDDASKATCLWLKNLPLLTPTKIIPPTVIGKKKIWGNQTPSGQNKLGPSPDRAKIRSMTYQGIADAIADQWG